MLAKTRKMWAFVNSWQRSQSCYSPSPLNEQRNSYDYSDAFLSSTSKMVNLSQRRRPLFFSTRGIDAVFVCPGFLVPGSSWLTQSLCPSGTDPWRQSLLGQCRVCWPIEVKFCCERTLTLLWWTCRSKNPQCKYVQNGWPWQREIFHKVTVSCRWAG